MVSGPLSKEPVTKLEITTPWRGKNKQTRTWYRAGGEWHAVRFISEAFISLCWREASNGTTGDYSATIALQGPWAHPQQTRGSELSTEPGCYSQAHPVPEGCGARPQWAGSVPPPALLSHPAPSPLQGSQRLLLPDKLLRVSILLSGWQIRRYYGEEKTWLSSKSSLLFF